MGGISCTLGEKMTPSKLEEMSDELAYECWGCGAPRGSKPPEDISRSYWCEECQHWCMYREVKRLGERKADGLED